MDMKRLDRAVEIKQLILSLESTLAHVDITKLLINSKAGLARISDDKIISEFKIIIRERLIELKEEFKLL